MAGILLLTALAIFNFHLSLALSSLLLLLLLLLLVLVLSFGWVFFRKLGRTLLHFEEVAGFFEDNFSAGFEVSDGEFSHFVGE